MRRESTRLPWVMNEDRIRGVMFDAGGRVIACSINDGLSWGYTG